MLAMRQWLLQARTKNRPSQEVGFLKRRARTETVIKANIMAQSLPRGYLSVNVHI